MEWIFLIAAALLEVAWAVGLKYTQNWTRPVPSLLVIGAYGMCLVMLSLAVRTIPVSVAYSVWVGLGIVGVCAFDTLVFREPLTLARMVCVGLILIGTIGLKITTSHPT